MNLQKLNAMTLTNPAGRAHAWLDARLPRQMPVAARLQLAALQADRDAWLGNGCLLPHRPLGSDQGGRLPRQLGGQLDLRAQRATRSLLALKTVAEAAYEVGRQRRGDLDLPGRLASASEEHAHVAASIGGAAFWLVRQACGLLNGAFKAAHLPLAWMLSCIERLAPEEAVTAPPTQPSAPPAAK